MTRPIQASLDLQALKQNLSIVRQAATHARVWSVVKANAYGHGIERIWSAIGATDGFALLNLEEAITLRERGWKGPILMLEGFFHAQDLEIYDQHRLTTCVHSNWQLKALQNARLKAQWDESVGLPARSRAYRLAAVAGNGECWRNDPDVAFCRSGTS